VSCTFRFVKLEFFYSRRQTHEAHSEVIGNKTSMITDEDPLRGLLFYWALVLIVFVFGQIEVKLEFSSSVQISKARKVLEFRSNPSQKCEAVPRKDCI